MQIASAANMRIIRTHEYLVVGSVEEFTVEEITKKVYEKALNFSYFFNLEYRILIKSLEDESTQLNNNF